MENKESWEGGDEWDIKPTPNLLLDYWKRRLYSLNKLRQVGYKFLVLQRP
jgi:hypothetical protein